VKKLIITGHGQYATGLKSSLDLLHGANEDLLFIDFPAEMSDSGLKLEMAETIQAFKDDEFLFVCDLLGGTPYKNAALLANDHDRIEVVAGCNIGAILEAVFQKEALPLTDLAAMLVETSKKYTVKFEKIKEVQPMNTEDSLYEDGI